MRCSTGVIDELFDVVFDVVIDVVVGVDGRSSDVMAVVRFFAALL